MKSIIFAGFAAALALLGASRASACSPGPDYRKPTNFEMVKLADAIVVATALEAINDGEAYGGRRVRFKVDEVLKGPAPEAFFAKETMLGSPPRSDPQDLVMPNAQSGDGGCIRGIFSKGAKYVIFLSKDSNGTWDQDHWIFGRVNEDYFGPDSLWVRTIRDYLTIQQNPDEMAQLDALDVLMRARRVDRTTPGARAEADDILLELQAPSPWKPTAALVSVYEALEAGKPPRWSDVAPSSARYMDPYSAVSLHMPPRNVSPVEQQKIEILSALALGRHPDAAPLFDKVLAEVPADPARLGWTLRFLTRNGDERKAYRTIEHVALPLLPRLSKEGAEELVGFMRASQDEYLAKDAPQPWKTVPEAAKGWPELDLDLHWFLWRIGGGEYDGGGDFGEIPVSDYRARPLLTLALAGGDPVTDWAIGELAKPSKPVDPNKDEEDPAYLPLSVLVLGFGDKRDAALEHVFCEGGARRTLLIETLGKWGDRTQLASDWTFAARIAAYSGLSDEDHEELVIALAHMSAAGNSAPEGPSAEALGNGGALDLLEKIIRKEKIDLRQDAAGARPLMCPGPTAGR
jgi:hypothetical protein